MRDFYTKAHEHEWQDKGIRKISIQEYRNAVPQHETRSFRSNHHKYRNLMADEEQKMKRSTSFFKYQQLHLVSI